MLTMSISDAKNKLSALIDKVKGGETVVITDRGRPVARLESAAADLGDVSGRLCRLERAGLIRRTAVTAPGKLILQPPPRLKAGVDVVKMVIEERSRGR